MKEWLRFLKDSDGSDDPYEATVKATIVSAITKDIFGDGTTYTFIYLDNGTQFSTKESYDSITTKLKEALDDTSRND